MSDSLLTWFFGALAVGAAAGAALLPGLRAAVLSLWVAGLSGGALFLSLGAEAIAVTQWVISTLGAFSLIFYSVMFGEYHPGTKRSAPVHPWRILVMGALSVGVLVIVSLAAESSVGSVPVNAPAQAALSLDDLGGALAGRHFLALEVLGILLLLTLVGGGVMARPESETRRDEA